MKKITGVFFAAAVLCFWVMATLVIAAPPRPQQSSAQESVVVVFPDIGPVVVHANNYSHPGSPPLSDAPPVSGDVISITCDYFTTGCFEQKAFSNRVDIDGILHYEKESYWLPPPTYQPLCSGVRASTAFSPDRWIATPGSHTIKCILDSKNNMAEGNELNNTKSITVNVPLPKPAIDKIKDIKTKQPIPVPVPGTR